MNRSTLPLLVNIWFQVLFHSPPGVLFTFPSRYYSSIGHQVVFSLGGWSPHIPAGFLVSRRTLDTYSIINDFIYGAVTLFGSTFQMYSTIIANLNVSPNPLLP